MVIFPDTDLYFFPPKYCFVFSLALAKVITFLFVILRLDSIVIISDIWYHHFFLRYVQIKEEYDCSH